MTQEEKLQTTRPEMTIDVNKTYIATMETSEGKVVLELDANYFEGE